MADSKKPANTTAKPQLTNVSRFIAYYTKKAKHVFVDVT
jgi:hypothetical protein